jgi:hypothetical protein
VFLNVLINIFPHFFALVLAHHIPILNPLPSDGLASPLKHPHNHLVSAIGSLEHNPPEPAFPGIGSHISDFQSLYHLLKLGVQERFHPFPLCLQVLGYGFLLACIVGLGYQLVADHFMILGVRKVVKDDLILVARYCFQDYSVVYTVDG